MVVGDIAGDTLFLVHRLQNLHQIIGGFRKCQPGLLNQIVA
jgi:hypothetical protein